MNVPYLRCLQTGRFRQFWDEAAKSRHIVEAVPGSNGLWSKIVGICWSYMLLKYFYYLVE